MKRRIYFLFGIIIAAIISWWLLTKQKHSIINEGLSPNDSASNSNLLISPLPQSQMGKMPSQNTSLASDASATNSTIKPRNLKEWAEREYSHPFLFYGKVVDQDGMPVQGATASFNWATPDEDEQRASSVSDSSGMFLLENGKGFKLQITVGKSNYYTPKSERLTTIAYGDELGRETFKANRNNPVVFHLRRKGEGADLIHGSKVFGSRIDGTMSYIDLAAANNSRTPSGDLTVQFVRGERNASKAFDWTFTLGAVGGGLVESTNEYMFLAPEDGYQPIFQISHKIGDPDWVSQEKHKFYVKSQDGQHYARIEITIIPYYQNNAAYDLTWNLNPNGSRNLEPK